MKLKWILPLAVMAFFFLLPSPADSYLPGPTEDREELERILDQIYYETSLVEDPTDYLPHNFTYVRVTYAASIYRTLADAGANKPFTTYGSGNRWATVRNQSVVDGKRYYRISWGWGTEGWVAADALSFSSALSRLKGIDISRRANQHLAIVYNDALNVRSEPGVIHDETLIGVLDKYSIITVQEQRTVNGARWYRIGPDQWVNAYYVRNFRPATRPRAVGATDRWIHVSLQEQTLIAYEGDTPVFATLVSTGRRDYETERGLFRVWLKYQDAPMIWPEADPPYSLANVPWIAYFNKGQGLHGVYWHDNYGTTRSAGCVNLSPHDSQWIFNWVNPPLPEGERTARQTTEYRGTWVWVTQ
jgi:lipoprotein-anchoring transpeptidase ErfK/SrfK